MKERQQGGLKKEVSWREAVPALLLVAVMFTGFAIVELYSKPIGYTLLVFVFVVIALAYIRIPKGDKEKLSEAVAKHDKTILGRLNNLLQFIFILFLLYSAAQYLYGNL
jgi:Ca2+/Na+ antiporter